MEPRRAFSDVTLEPPQSRLLVVRRPALRVEMDELGVLEREGRELAGRVLGEPQCAALDRSAEANVRVRLGGQETYVSWT